MTNKITELTPLEIGIKVIELATLEVGTKETPKGTNKTKYGKWFGLDGVAWCGIFVSYLYDKAGTPLGNIGFKKGYAGCGTAVAYFIKTNQVIKDTKDLQAGDIVFFDWNNDGRYDHTGIFIKKQGLFDFNTIEGNTAVGNDSNGGEVMFRLRSFNTKCVFVRPRILNKI